MTNHRIFRRLWSVCFYLTKLCVKPILFVFQATVFILDKLAIILAKTPTEEIKNEIIPLVFNTLDSNSIQAQVGYGHWI